MKPDLTKIRPAFYSGELQKRFCIVCHEQIKSHAKEYCSGVCMKKAGKIKAHGEN
jgi:hypothetical protein